MGHPTQMNDTHEPDRSRCRIDRRGVIKAGIASFAVVCAAGCNERDPADSYVERIADLEHRSGGRLGVGLLKLPSEDPVGHRLDERFGMCSTFKLALAAVILKETQEGRLILDRPVNYTSNDIVSYAPVTSQYLERGYMTVAELAEATQMTSDNTAANLLLDLIGGPAGFTDRLRKIGDTSTRLDRYEPEMNLVPPGEVRDTTTPAAMAATVRHIFSGKYLSVQYQQLLQTWMVDTETGLERLRAGFPAAWTAGDKTGTGIADSMANKYNDVAVAWPDDGTPSFVLAAYYEADDTYDTIRDQDEAVLRAVGQITANYLLEDGG